MFSALEKRILYADPEAPPQTGWRVALLVLWSSATLYLAFHHIVWRDEVRALSFAVQGQNVFAMLKGMHGEGHPAIWYLLLRGVHVLVPVPQVLPAVAFVVGFGAAALLTLRSPFNLPVIALLLSSGFFTYEYTVMARNYGISMVLMFVFATLFDRYRNRGLVLGLILFLLANCNVHSAFLVAAFLIFWLLEIVTRSGLAWSSELKVFFWNAAFATLGVVLCAMTVYPPINDAAVIDHPGGIHILGIVKALLVPGVQFQELGDIANVTFFHSQRGGSLLDVAVLFVSLAMFAATLGLIRRPSALIAALIALMAFSCFFKTVYPGSYRHEALWLVFLVSLYWLAARPEDTRTLSWPIWLKRNRPLLEMVGSFFLIVLLLLQLHVTATAVASIGKESRSADFGKLVKATPALQDATIIAVPDYLVDTIPYFVPNPTYLMRERRFGAISTFSKKSFLNLTLDEVLAKATQIRAQSGKPVVILLQYRLDAVQKTTTYNEAYNWTFSISPSMARNFLAATQVVKRFSPIMKTENFDVYLLK